MSSIRSLICADNFYNDVSAPGMVCDPADCDPGVLTKLTQKALFVAFKIITKLRPKLAARLEREVVEKHNTAFNVTKDAIGLERRYTQLGSKPEFLALKRAAATTLATWDDHDYCRNDAGMDCPIAERSRELFLNFWRGGDALAQRGKRRGIYDVHILDGAEPARRVQVLLLDTRTFRSELRVSPRNVSEAYGPQDASVQLLGEEQWRWLAEQLRQPASVRVVCSSISFAASYTGEEAWSLYPHEIRRMVTLIRSTAANGVVFISGDVHYGEISAFLPESDEAPPYPLYDVTSSGITASKNWHFHPPNSRRLKGTRLVSKRNNFGMLEVEGDNDTAGSGDGAGGLRLHFSIRGEKGEVLTNLTIPLRALQAPSGGADAVDLENMTL